MILGALKWNWHRQTCWPSPHRQQFLRERCNIISAWEVPLNNLSHISPPQAEIPSLCWKQTLANKIRMKGKPLCSQVTTAFNSDKAGAGVDWSSWASSLELCLSEPAAVVACWSRDEVLCCRGWWWKWWWWWWCWGGRGRKGPPSVRWGPPSSLDDAVIWIKTSGGEPKTKPAAWNWAEETELEGTPTRPEKICWGEAGESGFRQSNTPPSSRLLSDPRVWLRLLNGEKLHVV